MAGIWVLLLRGINVNPSTRVAMADLRELVEQGGFTDVKTLLQSGNVIARSAGKPDISALESAIVERTGVKSRVVALPIAEFAELVQANPLLDVSDDLSKSVISFFADDLSTDDVERLSDEELGAERLVLTPRAIYQWCPDGILQSKLGPKFWRQFDSVHTTRNVRTANRILEAAAALDA